MTRIALLLLAGIVIATPAVAQSDDAAYCAQLKELVLRYTGGAGVEGRLMPHKTTLGAIADCDKGNTAAGIPVLEKTLRDNGFTLPRH